MSTQTQVAATSAETGVSTQSDLQVRPGSLTQRMADRLGLEPMLLLNALQHTVFENKLGRSLSQSEVTSVMVFAEEHKLNPLNGELYLEADAGGRLLPTLTIDGWVRVMNNHPEFDGVEFKYADDYVTIGLAKPCPAWVEVSIYRKDRRVPTTVREHLDEVFNGDSMEGFGSSWLTHTKRRLRHKALAQCIRIAFGFGGAYDPDEVMRIIDGDIVDVSFADDVVTLDNMPIDEQLMDDIKQTVAGLVPRYKSNPDFKQSCIDYLGERWTGQALEFALDHFAEQAGFDQDAEIDAVDQKINSLTR